MKQEHKDEFLELIHYMPYSIITLRQKKDEIELLLISDSVEELTGYTKEEIAGNRAGKGNLLGSRDTLEKLFSDCRACKGKKKQTEVKVTHKNESTLWLSVNWMLEEINQEETELRFFLSDITEMKYLKAELENERERFEAVASLSKDVVFEYDIMADIMQNYVSSPKVPNAEYQTKDFSKQFIKKGIVYADDIPAFHAFVHKMRAGDTEMSVELRCKNKKNSYRWMLLKGKTLYNKEGEPIRVIGKIENINERKQKETMLAEQMNRDPLTKFYNYKAAQRKIEACLEEEEPEKADALFLINVDGFKILNDKLGFLFGDEILMGIAKCLRELFSPFDVVSRIGSDEFLVYMHNSGKEEAVSRAIKLNRAFSRIYTGEMEGSEVTACIGIVVKPREGITFRILYEKVQKALCYAKLEGKGQYNLYDPSKEAVYQELYVSTARWRKNRLELYPKNYQAFDYEITDFAFHLMEETKDADSAVNLLLRKVANYYRLSSICIKELSGVDAESGNIKVKYIYEYTEDSIAKRLNTSIAFNKKQWIKHIEGFGRDGICHCSDASMEPEPDAGWYRKNGIQAMVQCGFYNNGKFAGGVEFCDCAGTREWSKEELITFKRISRIISSYLLKMRAFEEASATVDNLIGYDEITGLLKYERFIKVAREQLQALAKDEDSRPVVIYSDISNFKYVNETYGYAAGDRILRSFAEHIMLLQPEVICGSRVSSDNIVALCRISKDQPEEEMISEVLRAREEFSRKQKELYADSNLIVNTGIYMIKNPTEDIVAAVDNANLARKKAKQPKQPKCILFQDDMNIELLNQILYLKDIQRGLENNEFTIFLQPKVDTQEDKIVGAEALIRWIKPDGTMIFPNSFIPVFEKNGSIVELDYYVYRKTFEYLRTRMNENKRIVPVSMNVSRLHLEDARLIDYIKLLVEEYRIPPDYLEFEITENVFIDNLSFAGRMIDEIKKLGISVSIDDFGSGYSSLNILKRLPIDILKLDKALLDDYDININGPIVIESIIRMADRMKIKVICEGVETKTQVEFLSENGCRYVQGYYYSKPVDIKHFNSMLESEHFSGV